MKKLLIVVVFILAGVQGAFSGDAGLPRNPSVFPIAYNLIKQRDFGYHIGDVVSYKFYLTINNRAIKLDFSRFPEPGEELGVFLVRRFELKKIGDTTYLVSYELQAFEPVKILPSLLVIPGLELRYAYPAKGRTPLHYQSLILPPKLILYSPMAIGDKPYEKLQGPFIEKRANLIGFLFSAAFISWLAGLVLFARMAIKRKRALNIVAVSQSFKSLKTGLEIISGNHESVQEIVKQNARLYRKAMRSLGVSDPEFDEVIYGNGMISPREGRESLVKMLSVLKKEAGL